MPELTEVETPKNAGFVQNKSERKANKKRIEQDEAELKALIEGKHRRIQRRRNSRNEKRPIQKLKKKRYLQKKERIKNGTVIYASTKQTV